MHGEARCIGENGSLYEAARMMRDLDVGALPICGEDQRLKGMITDRDIVVRCCAEGHDLRNTRAGEFAGELHWIDADADLRDVLDLMENHQVKRVPVIDVKNGHRLVGMISESDLARNITDEQLAEFVSKIFTPH
nr:CBS domain-containing protein [Streptoalloteichus hindustanus]